MNRDKPDYRWLASVAQCMVGPAMASCSLVQSVLLSTHKQQPWGLLLLLLVEMLEQMMQQRLLLLKCSASWSRCRRAAYHCTSVETLWAIASVFNWTNCQASMMRHSHERKSRSSYYACEPCCAVTVLCGLLYRSIALRWQTTTDSRHRLIA